MRAESKFKLKLQTILADMNILWNDRIVIEVPKDQNHGDLATNVALVLAKDQKIAPRQLAEKIILELAKDADFELSIAGPGFINIKFSNHFWQETVSQILKQKDKYGTNSYGENKKLQVEYVSANPTGPLHIGHGRGAAVGDSLARILRFSGYKVETEYYINDAGRQMRMLGTSIYLRLREALKLEVEFPDEYYKGSYIIDLALELHKQNPELINLPRSEAEQICFEYGMKSILQGIKDDLNTFRVEHQVWFSEQSLVDNGEVEASFNLLKAHLYEKDGATWFASTALGDDKDRVLRKSDGSLTYFASDIAYHANKYARGFDYIVDVWGADHHGYIPRVRSAIEAMGKPQSSFDVVLIQLVNLLKNGEQIAMSTRAGKFETLADVVQEVGVDAARFMFLSRKSDSPLDFDLELVKQRTMDNPVYYVQYAHARVCTLLAKAKEKNIDVTQTYLELLTGKEELNLIRKLDAFEDICLSAAKHLAPHFISNYLLELSSIFHSYYANIPVLSAEQDLVIARLALLQSVSIIISNGLELLGVSSPSSM